MTRPRAVLVDTGSCNLASVRVGLERAGAQVCISCDRDVIGRAERLVLPGVGSFGAGMSRLVELSLVDLLKRRMDEGRPLLAVCLGLQLLCEASDETSGVSGLGVLPTTVRRFESAPTVPQLGWNRVEPDTGCQLLEPGYAYYANSYRLDAVPSGWRGATSVHGERFVAAVERGPMLACQFHPELSGGWGQALLCRWLEASSC